MGKVKKVFKYTTKILGGSVAVLLDMALGTEMNKGLQKSLDDLFDDNSTPESRNETVRNFIDNSSSNFNNQAQKKAKEIDNKERHNLVLFENRLRNYSDSQLIKADTSRYSSEQLEVWKKEMARRGLH